MTYASLVISTSLVAYTFQSWVR